MGYATMENKDVLVSNYLNITIKVKYFRDDLTRLKIDPKGDMIDLYAAEDVTINEMDEALIPLGVAMELPIGYRANLLPRSSTFKKWGIIVTNSMGVIDHTYCGDNDEWKLAVFCLKGREFVNGKKCTIIHKGDKIAQFEIVDAMEMPTFKKVEDLGNYNRGGFGSTGEK